MNYRETEFFEKHGIHIQKVIARGSNSVIFLVHSNQYDCDLVLKKCCNLIFSEKELENFITLNSPSFVKLYQYFNFSGSFYLLMEYCPSDLKKMIEEIDISKEDKLRSHVKEVVQAVYSCHNLNTIS